SFSADKVLGGPQAGIIVGRRDLITVLEHHPLMRVFRPGKTIYSLLEATLVRRLNGFGTTVSRTFSVSMKELKARGRKILQGIDRQQASVAESTFTTGGGSSPDESFPSLSIVIHAAAPPAQVLRTLREADPPIIGTISDDKVQLNLATIQDSEIPHIRTQLQKILGG
ncbi:MAG: L-seryl-tRNA(Sec) selenium transferase, partial [Spirochaetota bacterium]|nr:L-seryl-tRNA(Sec) selenium transferase [Spirochaetota bacterium]